MIRFFDEKDRNTIVCLWKEAFGDSEESIAEFLELFSKYMLVLSEGNEVVSMLTLFPVKLGGEKGRYVYAVATDKAYRNRGFARNLIEYAKAFIREKNEKFLTILPQSDSLYDFYKKFGFSELKCVKRIETKLLTAEQNDIYVKKITPNEYFELRNAFFGGSCYICWDEKMLDYFQKMYNGVFLEILSENVRLACAFCYQNGKKIIIPELLTDNYDAAVLSSIGRFFGAEEVSCNKAEKNGERFAMIYPQTYTDAYFGIGMN